jgi:hypothetical protein
MRSPKYFEYSWVPTLLSYLSPIEIWAITLGPFVFCAGQLSRRTKNHEAIHWEQYKELYIAGFVILYAYYWLLGVFKYRDTEAAYYSIPFEQEAYSCDQDFEYLKTRTKYSWTKYHV